MGELLKRFMQFYQDNTKQIGANFCIPASLCNAVRLFGVTDCTQEKIRDAWYAEQGNPIEPNIDDQMQDASITIFETMERNFSGMNDIDNDLFRRPGDKFPLYLQVADHALEFIEKHILAQHPVIVSTWNRFHEGEIIRIKGHHMWLVLDFNREANLAVFHDSSPDRICETAITNLKPIKLDGVEHQIDMGLRGCITHDDYTCLALWKES